MGTHLTEERNRGDSLILEGLEAEYLEQSEEDESGGQRGDWQSRETDEGDFDCERPRQGEESRASSSDHFGNIDSIQQSERDSDSSESDSDQTECDSLSDASTQPSSSQVLWPVDSRQGETVTQLTRHHVYCATPSYGRLEMLAAAAHSEEGCRTEKTAGHRPLARVQPRTTSAEQTCPSLLLLGPDAHKQRLQERAPIATALSTNTGLNSGEPAFGGSFLAPTETEYFGLRGDVFMGNEHNKPDGVDFGQFSCSGEVPRDI